LGKDRAVLSFSPGFSSPGVPITIGGNPPFPVEVDGVGEHPIQKNTEKTAIIKLKTIIFFIKAPCSTFLTANIFPCNYR
jgi:hypothetical protein